MGALVVLLGLAGWLAVLGSLHASGGRGELTAVTVTRFAGGYGFLAAAVLSLLAWWSARDAGRLRDAVGLGIASLFFPLTMLFGPWMSGGRVTAVGVIARGVLLAPVIVLLAARSRDRLRGTALALMVAAQTARVLGLTVPGRLDGFAPALDLAAAALFALETIGRLRAVVQDEREREGALELRLATTEALLERHQQRQRQRLHDARSAVAGVLGASAVLTGDDSRRAELTELVAAELHRLAALLGVDGSEPAEPFDVEATLTPVLEMHRLECPHLTWQVEPATAVGRAGATATALDNLLRNARVHAPGAAVEVWTRTTPDGTVEIVVDDGGPGIPAHERAEVLRAGARGAGARGPGSGLGLFNVLTSMTDQRGRLSLAESPAGGLRATLSLPMATTALTAA